MPEDSGAALYDDHFAILVAIDTYPELRRLRGSVADATRFSEWLLSPQGGRLPKGNIIPVYSPDPQPRNSPFLAIPTRADIDDALAKAGVRPGNRAGKRLYFYFAGHGLGISYKNVAMLMASAADIRPNDNIGLQPYRDFLNEYTPFEEVVFILDCCRSLNEWGAQAQPPSVQYARITTPPSPVQEFVILAANYGEEAYQPSDPTAQPGSNKRHGLLTTALLEGLEGQAADRHCRVTARSLAAYLRRRVPDLAEDIGQTQEPTFDPTEPHELVLAVVADDKVPRVQLRIIAPPGLGGTLRLRGDEEQGVISTMLASSVTAEQQPWTQELYRNAKYAVEHVESGRSQSFTLEDKPDSYTYTFPAS